MENKDDEKQPFEFTAYQDANAAAQRSAPWPGPWTISISVAVVTAEVALAFVSQTNTTLMTTVASLLSR